MSKHKNSVIFLKDWIPLIESMPETSQINFWSMFVRYESGSEDQPTDPNIVPIWAFIKSQLDKFDSNYNDKVVSRNRENGKNGGRPKKTQVNPKNPVGLNETQKTLNENKNINKNKNNNENSLLILWSHALKNEGWVNQIKTLFELSDDKFLNYFNQHDLLYPDLMDKDKFDDARKHFLNTLKSEKKKGNLGGEFVPEGRGRWEDRPDGSGRAWISYD